MLKVGPFSLEKGLSLAIFLLSFTIRDTKLNSHYLPTLLHGTERFLCDIWAGRLLFKKPTSLGGVDARSVCRVIVSGAEIGEDELVYENAS